MESKIDQRESMPPRLVRESVKARALLRDRIADMVGDQERRAGSRMLAYRAVGRLLSVSDTWVRRLLYGQSVRIELETLTAADSAWAAHCARLEARAAALLAAAARRQGTSDAILASLRGAGPGHDHSPSQSPAPGPGEIDRAKARDAPS